MPRYRVRRRPAHRRIGHSRQFRDHGLWLKTSIRAGIEPPEREAADGLPGFRLVLSATGSGWLDCQARISEGSHVSRALAKR